VLSIISKFTSKHDTVTRKALALCIFAILSIEWIGAQSNFPLPDSSRYYVVAECDTFSNVNDECIDSEGRRQGHWEFKNRAFYKIPINDEITGEEYEKETQDLRIASGYYIDGRRSGRWCFENYSTYYSWEHIYWCLYSIEYYLDSTIYTKGYPCYYTIVYDKDSLVLHGRTQIDINGDYWSNKVVFKCEEGVCMFWDEKIPEIIIEECKLEDAEFYVERFNVGMYNREILFNRMNSEAKDN